MAEKERPTHSATGPETEAPKNDIQALIRHVRENPLAYVAGVAFVLVVLAVAGLYNIARQSGNREAASEFMRALDHEDPAERSAALAAVADSGSYLAPKALYLRGEAALEAGETAAAREAFTRLRETYPEFELVPAAVEGLGFLHEDQGEFDQARAVYEEVAQKWPDSPTAKWQPFNVGRCYEAEDNLPAAIEQYRKQLEVFPGSTIAARAQQRLNELRTEHPELFEQPAREQPALQQMQSPTVDDTTDDTTTEGVPEPEIEP